MPKFTRGHKPRARAVTKASAPRAIGDLLARATPALAQIGEQRTRQTFWRSWLASQLPDTLAAHLTGAIERDGALTLFVDSSAWAARLRYALRELEPGIRAARAGVLSVAVRVLPRA
jgi:predicted nucleic acid-binding Zn ribbon protein